MPETRYTRLTIEPRNCGVCGESYQPRQRNQRNCSRRCYENRVRPPHRRVVGQGRCDWCSEPFDVWSDYREQTYCSKSCALQSRRKTSCSIFGRSCRLFISECAVCDRPFTSRYAHHRVGVCSSVCRNLIGNHGPEGARAEVTCVLCGETWHRWERPSVSRYCSDDCRVEAIRQARKVTKKQRAKHQHTHFIEPIFRRKVFERDDWICHLCGEPTNPEAEVPDPLAPTIDHLTPLALGGEHAYRNVQTAHFVCNSRKGSRVAGQLHFAA